MIDKKLLPEYALLDTSVLIAAFKEPPEADHAISLAFIEAMVNAGRELAIAAPSLAELVVGSGEPPLVRQIRVLPFDQRAALVFGRRYSRPDLRREIEQVQGSSRRHLVKFDLQIIACGLAHRVNTLVTLDPNQKRRADEQGLLGREPGDYAAPQLALFPGSSQKP